MNYIGSKRAGAREISTLDPFGEVLVEDFDQWNREAEAGSFTHHFHLDRFRMLHSDCGRQSTRNDRSVFFSNCLPGGELAVLAAYLLD